MTLSLDNSLIDLAHTLGELPGGDTPAAWYASMTDEVLEAYDAYLADQRAWNDRYAELLAIGKLPPDSQFVTEGAKGHLLSIVAPKDMGVPPRWWRRDSFRGAGTLVPRKRTTEERHGPVNALFTALRTVLRPIDYLPGLPQTLIVGDKAYAPQVRRPAAAVLVFLAADPLTATQPFEMGPQWAQMKLSLFHVLQERQRAARQVR